MGTMKEKAIVLSVAGSDSSGGAGIQADIKTISALGGYAATAITAITVQNTLGVQAVHPVPAELVGELSMRIFISMSVKERSCKVMPAEFLVLSG